MCYTRLGAILSMSTQWDLEANPTQLPCMDAVVPMGHLLYTAIGEQSEAFSSSGNTVSLTWDLHWNSRAFIVAHQCWKLDQTGSPQLKTEV